MHLDLLALAIACNLGVLLVLGARGLWRSRFGAQAAYGLWALPLLCALATAIPAADRPLAPVRDLLGESTPVISTLAAASQVATPNWLAWLWIAGVLTFAGYFIYTHERLARQWRNRAREHDARAPNLRLVRGDLGPALVGLWRPLLLLPHDFEQRFDPTQQRLVLAHEQAHASAGDLPVRWLALCVVILQWWNPLAWFALRRLIEDQEFACDARVLSNDPQALAAYARTLSVNALRPPYSTALVCSLHQQHPLLRRIAMLKNKLPDSATRRLGYAAILVAALGVTAIGWATPGSTASSALSAQSNDFWVEFTVQVGSGEIVESSMGASVDQPIQLRATTAEGEVEIDVQLSKVAAPDQVMLNLVITRGSTELARPALLTKLDQEASIVMGESKTTNFEGLRIGATVSAWGQRVNVPMVSSSAREIAVEIARESGLTLEGAELLSNAHIEAKLDSIDAYVALQILADSSGLDISRDQDRVRFRRKLPN